MYHCPLPSDAESQQAVHVARQLRVSTPHEGVKRNIIGRRASTEERRAYVSNLGPSGNGTWLLYVTHDSPGQERASDLSVLSDTPPMIWAWLHAGTSRSSCGY